MNTPQPCERECNCHIYADDAEDFHPTEKGKTIKMIDSPDRRWGAGVDSEGYIVTTVGSKKCFECVLEERDNPKTQIADETQIQIIGGIINDLEWLNEMPDGDWVDGHGDTQNKAESVQRTINKLRELVGCKVRKEWMGALNNLTH